MNCIQSSFPLCSFTKGEQSATLQHKFSRKALNNCSILKIQQSESAIKHQIYFTVEFQDIASNILRNVSSQTLRLRKNMAFYTKQDFSAISFQ